MKIFLIIFFSLLLIQNFANADFSYQGEISLRSKNESNLPYKDKNLLGFESYHQNIYNINRQHQIEFTPYIRSYPNAKDAEKKLYLDFKDFSYNFKRKSNYLSVGFKQLSWQGTDFVNPMDSLSPQDFSDPLLIRTQAIPGVFFSSSLANINFDFVYAPENRLSRLPGLNSSWYPRKLNYPIENDQAQLILPEQAEYTLQKNKILNSANRNNFSFRISTIFNETELALAFTESVSSTPVIQPSVLNGELVEIAPVLKVQLINPIEITPVYYKQNALSGYLSNPFIFNTVLKFAARKTSPLGDGKNFANPSSTYVLSLEKNMQILNKDIYFVLSQIQLNQVATNENQTTLQILKNAYLIAAKAVLTDKLSAQIASAFETKNKLYLNTLSLKYQILDNLGTDLSFYFLDVDKNSEIFYISKNDRMDFTLTYSY